MKPLRRVLLATEPGKNGVFIVVRDLVHHLHRVHPEIVVDLAYSSRRELGEATALAGEVRERGGEAIDLHVSSFPEPADLGAAWKIASLVFRRRPQIIHAHSSKAGALCRLLALLPGFPPVVYTPHAYYGVARKGGRKEKVFNAIEMGLGGIGVTACCSSDERDFGIEALKLNPDRLITLYNGLDTAKFSPAGAAEKEALRDRLGIPRDGRLLVTVGRDTPQKNYAPLYIALDRVLAARTDLRFAHAGEGSVPLKAGLSPAATARVHAFDHLDAPQDLVRAADGFILTSHYEGFALSMIEALSCGTPTILTDVPGLKAIRELGFRWTQWLPKPDDSPAFIDGIERSVEEWLAGPTGPLEAQRALACEQLDQSRQFEKLIELYRSRL